MWNWQENKLVAWSDTFEHFSAPGRHEELVETLKDKKLFSILIFADFLEDDLREDPEHCRKDLHVLVSEVEEEARKQIGYNGYYSKEEILELCERFGLEVASHSYNEEDNRKHWIKLENAFIELRQRLLVPSILQGFKKSFKETDPDTWEDRDSLLTKEDMKTLWPDYFMKIMMPRTSKSYHRNYDYIPKPMCYWDSRHSWQQYFFISDGEGAPIQWIKGGYASSGARENQGRMAHTFATLDGSMKIKTLIARYTSKNILVPDVEFESFKTQPQELSGNYYSNRDVIRELFKGKLITVDREDFTWGAVLEKADAENAY